MDFDALWSILKAPPRPVFNTVLGVREEDLGVTFVSLSNAGDCRVTLGLDIQKL